MNIHIHKIDIFCPGVRVVLLGKVYSVVLPIHFREKTIAHIEQKRKEDYQRGKQVREQREEEKTAQRENEVQNLEVSEVCNNLWEVWCDCDCFFSRRNLAAS